MSKTNELQMEKSLTLLNGLREHFEEVKNKGINEELLNQIERLNKELKERDEDLDKRHEEIHQIVQSTNDCLNKLKEETQKARMIVRNNYPPEQWLRFGLTDKR